MLNDDSSFVIGTMVFLVAHLVYIVAFRVGTPIRKMSFKTRLAIYGGVFFCLGTYIGNTITLWEVLPSKYLFPIYGFIVCMMSVTSLLRYENTTPYSFYFIMVGAILFGVSDHLLGFLKFNGIKTDLGRVGVMLTYYAGQYLIMHGSLHHSNLQQSLSQIFKTKN